MDTAMAPGADGLELPGVLRWVARGQEGAATGAGPGLVDVDGAIVAAVIPASHAARVLGQEGVDECCAGREHGGPLSADPTGTGAFHLTKPGQGQ